tara:strand:- start:678 stop:977 length:300 start_codon:yes stop_codon:yes gene_type:complete
MKYIFQSINFNSEDKLINLVKKRTNKLKLFFNKINSVQVYAKLKNNNTSLNKEVELMISLPGENLIARKTSYSFESSLKLVLSKIFRMLKKRKYKLKNI